MISAPGAAMSRTTAHSTHCLTPFSSVTLPRAAVAPCTITGERSVPIMRNMPFSATANPSEAPEPNVTCLPGTSQRNRGTRIAPANAAGSSPVSASVHAASPNVSVPAFTSPRCRATDWPARIFTVRPGAFVMKPSSAESVVAPSSTVPLVPPPFSRRSVPSVSASPACT